METATHGADDLFWLGSLFIPAPPLSVACDKYSILQSISVDDGSRFRFDF
jgi:hypothetical protein